MKRRLLYYSIFSFQRTSQFGIALFFCFIMSTSETISATLVFFDYEIEWVDCNKEEGESEKENKEKEVDSSDESEKLFQSIYYRQHWGALLTWTTFNYLSESLIFHIEIPKPPPEFSFLLI